MVMDALGVNMKSCSKRNGKKYGKKGIKVVYISSPMMVKTSASQFRALVQQLTGKDSDTAERFGDVNSGTEWHSEMIDPNHQGVNVVDDDHHHASMDQLMGSSQEPSTSSDSIFEPFDDLIFPPMEAGFTNMLQSNFFPESSLLDLLNV
uniref:VQ domain-containing protein n=1 Tax=Rhizophora mucronata TaxID=61149 RepID=A0A2P2ISP3_RHIMU